MLPLDGNPLAVPVSFKCLCYVKLIGYRVYLHIYHTNTSMVCSSYLALSNKLSSVFRGELCAVKYKVFFIYK